MTWLSLMRFPSLLLIGLVEPISTRFPRCSALAVASRQTARPTRSKPSNATEFSGAFGSSQSGCSVVIRGAVPVMIRSQLSGRIFSFQGFSYDHDHPA